MSILGMSCHMCSICVTSIDELDDLGMMSPEMCMSLSQSCQQKDSVPEPCHRGKEGSRKRRYVDFSLSGLLQLRLSF